MTVTPQTGNLKTSNSSKIPSEYLRFTFGEMTFTSGEIRFTLGLVAQTLHQGCRATAVALHLCSICGLVFSQCRTTVALHPQKGLKKGTVAAASVLLGGGGSTSSWPYLYHTMVLRYSGCSSYNVALSRYTATLRL